MPFDPSSAQLVNQPQTQDGSNFDPSSATLVAQQNGWKPVMASEQQSPLNFGDMFKMASLTDPQSQQTYLKSKFRFAEPITDANGQPTGQFNVGNDPNNLIPIHPGGIGDMAMKTLASVASTIPSIGGQMGGAGLGAEIGSAIAPGPGTVIGGLIGAGVGAMGGEAVRNLAISNTPGYDPAKAKTDNIIAGVFGTVGEGLGQAINLGVKNYITPKIASAIDGAIAQHPNPLGGAQFMSKVMRFVGGMDQDEAKAGFELGYKNISNNPKNWDTKEIDNIAQGVVQGLKQKEGIAKLAVDRAEKSLLADNPDAMVGTSRIIENSTNRLQQMGVLDKVESAKEGMQTSFKFRDDVPSDVPLKGITTFLKRLGAEEIDGTFHIPENANVSLSEAIKAKRLFQNIFNSPNLNPSIQAIGKNALYDEEVGLRTAINDTAKATGHDAYIIANKNFSDLQNVKNGVLADNMGNKSILPRWMDVENPASVAKYLEDINKKDMFAKQGIANLQNIIGHDFVTPTREWAVAQALSRCQPQLLRLSVVGSLFGLFTGGLASGAAKLPAAFALGSAAGVGGIARASEILGEANLKGLGNSILNNFSKGATSSVGKAVLSQLIRKKNQS